MRDFGFDVGNVLLAPSREFTGARVTLLRTPPKSLENIVRVDYNGRITDGGVIKVLEAGLIEVTLDNSDQQLNHLDKGEPFKVEVGVKVNGVTEYMNMGVFHVLDFDIGKEAYFTGVDQLSFLLTRSLPNIPTAKDVSVGWAIEHVMTRLGITNFSIDSELYQVNVPYVFFLGETVGEFLDDILNVEMTYLFARGDGELVFKCLKTLAGTTTVLRTYTEDDSVIDHDFIGKGSEDRGDFNVSYYENAISDLKEIFSLTNFDAGMNRIDNLILDEAPVLYMKTLSIRESDSISIEHLEIGSDKLSIEVYVSGSRKSSIVAKGYTVLQSEEKYPDDSGTTLLNSRHLQSRNQAQAVYNRLSEFYQRETSFVKVQLTGDLSIEVGDTIRVISASKGISIRGFVTNVSWTFDGSLAQEITLTVTEVI